MDLIRGIRDLWATDGILKCRRYIHHLHKERKEVNKTEKN